MYTYTNCYLPQTPLPQTTIFGVIIHSSPSQNKETLKFKITTLNREICEHINNPQNEYHLNAFTTAYDAQKYIESVLTPEDEFKFHLEDYTKILIDQWYIRDSESVDLLLQNV